MSLRNAGWLLLLLLAWTGAGAARAGEADPPALGGLDPVELCGGREVPGAADREATHGAYRYRFASEQTRERFRSDPERWGIQWAGACGRMGPASGKGDAARWLVHDGRIWIFASESCRSAFARDPAAHLEPDEAPPEGGDAERAEGLRWLDRAVAAVGGAATLDALRSLRLAYEQPSGTPGLTTTTDLSWGFPGRFRRHREHGGRWPETHVLTPDDAFTRTAEGVEALHPAARRELERAALRNPVVLLRARREPGFVALHAGATKVGEAAAVGVELWVDGLRATLALDPEGGRPLALLYRGRTSTGAFGRVEDRLSDWRVVDGLWLPHRRDVLHAGAALVPGGVRLTAAAVNPALPEGWFRR